jgi:hypothetical protein
MRDCLRHLGDVGQEALLALPTVLARDHLVYLVRVLHKRLLVWRILPVAPICVSSVTPVTHLMLLYARKQTTPSVRL